MRGRKLTLLYPLVVGILLGWLQTSLFFQLTFTYSSGFTTYVLITLCWLTGSALGIYCARRLRVSLRFLLIVMLSVFLLTIGLAGHFPFQSQLWPLYSLLIVSAGLFPGTFFARLSRHLTARHGQVFGPGNLLPRRDNSHELSPGNSTGA